MYCGGILLGLLIAGFSLVNAQGRSCGYPLGSIRIIDTFSTCISIENDLPCGWYATQKDVKMFSIKEENGNRFLKIRTSGGNTSLGVRCCFEAGKFRFLCWRWRIHQFPRGAREDWRKYSDSAAGVYVIFNGYFRLNRIIKYVWSSSLKKGVVTESPYNRRTKIVVLRSGRVANGDWVEEKVDIFGDYQKIFGGEPPKIEGIAILSDSDNTESTVEADYDDFLISVE